MSSNYWNQQEDARNPQQQPPSMNGNGNGASPRTGSLLRNYNAQHTMPAPQGWPTPQGPAPISPIPPSSSHFLPQQAQQQFPQFPQGQQQMLPAPGYSQNSPTVPAGRPGSVFSSAMNTVRRWSGKMAATRGGYADPNPLVLHRPRMAEPVNKRAPWKRSHALRVSMQ